MPLRRHDGPVQDANLFTSREEFGNSLCRCKLFALTLCTDGLCTEANGLCCPVTSKGLSDTHPAQSPVADKAMRRPFPECLLRRNCVGRHFFLALLTKCLPNSGQSPERSKDMRPSKGYSGPSPEDITD